MPAPPTIRCFSDGDALASAALAFIIHAAQDAIAARGRFTIALTGGSSPVATYALLARTPPGQIAWDKWEIFLGDDRFVPAGDDRSNYGQARRLLLDNVPVPAKNIHPIDTGAASPAAAATEYSETLRQVFGLTDGAAPPVFDLVLLGLGDDGHCASLFPHMPTLAVTDLWVVSTPPGTLPPPVDRVTLTYPVLNAPRQVLFLVSGANKAAPVFDILEGGASREVHPAAGIRPVSGTLTWMLDAAAASLLTESRGAQRVEHSGPSRQ